MITDLTQISFFSSFIVNFIFSVVERECVGFPFIKPFIVSIVFCERFDQYESDTFGVGIRFKHDSIVFDPEFCQDSVDMSRP